MKKFTLLQLFTLVDGRISTSMKNIQEMIEYVCDRPVLAHQIPIAFIFIKNNKPLWFKNVKEKLEEIKRICNTNDFEIIVDYIQKNESDRYFEVNKLKDEFDTSELITFLDEEPIPCNTLLVGITRN